MKSRWRATIDVRGGTGPTSAIRSSRSQILTVWKKWAEMRKGSGIPLFSRDAQRSAHLTLCCASRLNQESAGAVRSMVHCCFAGFGPRARPQAQRHLQLPQRVDGQLSGDAHQVVVVVEVEQCLDGDGGPFIDRL